MFQIDKQLWPGPVVAKIGCTVIWKIRTKKMTQTKWRTTERTTKIVNVQNIHLQSCTGHELISTQQVLFPSFSARNFIKSTEYLSHNVASTKFPLHNRQHCQIHINQKNYYTIQHPEIRKSYALSLSTRLVHGFFPDPNNVDFTISWIRPMIS
jgi:hypothetical protein